jgi:hypothetical protein
VPNIKAGTVIIDVINKKVRIVIREEVSRQFRFFISFRRGQGARRRGHSRLSGNTGLSVTGTKKITPDGTSSKKGEPYGSEEGLRVF